MLTVAIQKEYTIVYFAQSKRILIKGAQRNIKQNHPYYKVAWMSRNSLLEGGAKSEVWLTATGLEPTTT